MSKMFFDHLIEIEEIEIYINKVSQTHEEKADLWEIVDEFVSGQILTTIYRDLDEEHHEEFTSIFLEKPYDVSIIDYLENKLTCPFCELLDESKKRISADLCKIFALESKETTPSSKKIRSTRKKS